MKLEFIDFSKLTHDEAVSRLERVQAQLYELAKLQKARLKNDDTRKDLAATIGIGFADGTIHATTIALDFLQEREPGTNLRDLMGVKEPTCDEPLFV